MAKPLLTKKDINRINNLIITWDGKLNWELVVQAIKSDLGIKISRQSLNKYEEIKQEFRRRKELKRGVVTEGPVTYAEGTTVQKLEKQIKRLEAENDALQRKYNEAEKFMARAIKNGIDMEIDVTKLFFHHPDEDSAIE